MKTWLILGGGGVFAQHLARYLHGDIGTSLILVGRNPKPAAPWWLAGATRYEQIHILHELRRLFRLIDEVKPDFIVNFAALAYATSWKDSDWYYLTNTVALAKLTEYLAKSWFGTKFIQIGTSELYGSVTAPAAEDAPLRPTSPYAVSKMAADLHLLTLTPRGFPAVVLRPSNCYGEGQQLYRLVPRACWCALTGNKLPLEGGGAAVKSFMHAEDLARAIVTVAEHGVVGEVYNAGPPKPVTMLEIVQRVAASAGISCARLTDVAPARPGEDARYWLDSSKLMALGWEPTIRLSDGLARCLDWTNEHLADLGAPAPFVLRA